MARRFPVLIDWCAAKSCFKATALIDPTIPVEGWGETQEAALLDVKGAIGNYFNIAAQKGLPSPSDSVATVAFVEV